MSYSKEHKAETRTRIVASARSLFNRRGFAEVSIDEIMANAGLTRGGFYNHFATKEELYAEVVRYALTCAPQERLPHVDPAAPPDTIARQLVSAYLSNGHLQDRERSCSLVALASDVGRGGAAVRRAYQHVVESMVGVFARGMSADDAHARARALAITSLCVGSMVMSRAIDDESLAHDLRQAAEEAALSLGGWDGDRSRVAAE
jgi:TetR/AcrR family transcriptional regulator, transcriptional repressor for nem operon